MRETETNRGVWEERTAIHLASSWYDVEGFRRNRCTLRSVELEEVGDVAGKRLLHLQCHFGLDTLSWARRGAKVTGADFSHEAIAFARRLADELHLDAEFVCSDIYDLPDNLAGVFDIVLTTYGVLAWLPDLTRWGEVIAQFLDDGGAFYIVEKHPLFRTLVEEDGKLVAAKPYFDVGPIVVRSERTYAAPEATLTNDTYYQWQHSLSDVVNALTGTGLHIEFLHELPFSLWRLPTMVPTEDGWWRLPDRDLPLMFSLRARKR